MLARDYECHHDIALVNGGENREGNLRPAHRWCHRLATNADVAEKSRVYRKRATHVVGRKPRRITRWRNFRGEIITKPRERF